jgi:hypothetical protein
MASHPPTSERTSLTLCVSPVPRRVIILTGSYRDDEVRWLFSEDGSPIDSSSMIWLFAKVDLRDINHEDDGDLKESPQFEFFVRFRNTDQQYVFRLDGTTCLMLACLDLDYWSTVTLPPSARTTHTDHTARYLSNLRLDLVKDVRRYIRESFEYFGDYWNVEAALYAIRPWAVRVRYEFGHSVSGRESYKRLAARERCEPYQHDYCQEYGEWMCRFVIRLSN